MLSVVTMFFLRHPLRKPYQAYRPEHVNTLFRSVSRNLTIPHEFVCITDRPAGLDPAIKIAPLATDLIWLGNAYPKLALFKADPPGINGEHICFTDLDVAITGPLDAVIQKGIDNGACFLPEFITKRPAATNAHYNTSFYVIKRGGFPQVWDKFDPQRSPEEVRKTRKVGSDQVWVSETLGGGMPTWPAGGPIISYKYDVRGHGLPAGARVVCFHGQFKPWDKRVQANNPWILQHWR